MTEQQEPNARDRERPEPSASGLHEADIAAEDLAEIRSRFKLASLELGITAETNELQTDMVPAAAQRMRVVQLPDKVRIRKHKLPKHSAIYKQDIPAALRVPIQRERINQHDLSLDQANSLRQSIVERFGPEAPVMLIEAIYPHVPPEAAQSVRVEPSLAKISFSWPGKLKVTKARAGFYLVILRDTESKRFQLLLRL